MRFLLVLFTLFPFLLVAQADSLLSSALWVEVSPGGQNGYTLYLDRYGPFEEDAGTNGKRKSRYLLGRWELDANQTELTLAVDYFLGEKTVHRRYRRGQDFYIGYKIVSLNAEELILEDKQTGEVRTFSASSLKDHLDAGERKAKAIQLAKPKKGGIKIPDGW